MNAIVPVSDTTAAIVERVIIHGDLSKLTPQERVHYYNEVCKSVGLNPLTKPFEYITLNNKLTLYALRACTDQLRSIYAVSVEDLAESEREGVFIVTAKVRNGEGRTDIAKGAVNIAGLKGEALANAMMKAETKAKRRATLSLCGLGWLDESEVDSIHGATRGEPQTLHAPSISPPSPPSPPRAPAPRTETHDPKTGELYTVLYQVKADGKPNWLAWGKVVIDRIMAADTHERIDAVRAANAEHLAKCEQEAPKAFASIQKAIAKRSNELLETKSADDEYNDWLAELDACTSENAVDDLRERALPNIFPGDRDDFKRKCDVKSASLF